MEQLQIVREFAATLMRRFVLFAFVAIAGTLASIWYALSLDRVYEATAVVQIVSPQIASDMAGDINRPAAQRVQLIEQQIFSRDSMFEVAEKYDLFDAPDMTVMDRANLMRMSIRLNRISGVTVPGQLPQPSGLTIIVRLSDAEKTALVANELVTRVLERNLQDRERQAADTLDFFRREEERLNQQIVEVDDRIVEFKRDNSGSLPDGLEFRRDELTRLGEDRREISRQLITLDRELAALEETGGESVNTSSDALSQEISRLQIDLARRQASTPGNREIPFLQEQIALLQSNRDEDRRLTTERQRQLIDEEIALLQTQVEAIETRQSELNALIQAAPGVENQLAALMRQREQLQQRYASAIQGRSEAEVAQRLEANRQSERFEVLESAIVPDYPVAPSRKKIVLMGTAASTALGAALVFLLEMLRPVIRTSAQFRRQLGVAPTISVPHVFTTSEQRQRRTALVAVVVLILVGLPASLLIVDQYVMSFEEMAQIIDGIPFLSSLGS